MKKLKLTLEALAVESFATAATPEPRGTVRAHATEFGQTCDPGPSCGPETCGQFACIFETQNANLCGVNTPACPGTNTCPTGAQLSCAGCTTFDYTANPVDDSCGFCMSFESDSPQRCRCI